MVARADDLAWELRRSCPASALQDGLAAWRRQLLPARKQSLANFALLLGSHLLPDLLAIAQVLLLRRRQAIPSLQALADLRLLFRAEWTSMRFKIS